MFDIKRNTAVAVTFYFLGLAGSCNINTDDISKATKNITDASKQLNDGMTKLSNLDPLALNRLLKENADLKAQFETVRGVLNANAAPGNIGVGPNTRAVFEITGYTGQLRIDAWVDTPQNKFISNRVLLNAETGLDMTYTHGHDDIYNTWNWCNSTGQGNVYNSCFVNYIYNLDKGKLIDSEYQAAVSAALEKFLAQPFVLPSVDMAQQAFDQRFYQEGEHALFVQVTPEKLDSHGSWVLEYKMYTTGPSDKEERFFVGRIDSDKTKYTLGQPTLPDVNVFKVMIIK
jgi:hypothetical protein